MQRSKRFLVFPVLGLAALFVGRGVPAAAQAPTSWVARYSGPGNNSHDTATALTVDDSGDVYVTGYDSSTAVGPNPGSAYATVKYDADGNQLWVARYDGPGNFFDFASAIAVDDAGNVYVTGSSYGAGTGYDYATIKYDADGNEVWVARYSGALGGREDAASALAVDGAGNVYVTGQSSGGSGTGTTAYDYATIKYDADGNVLWVRRYDGPGNSNDRATALTLDHTGNVYVTGGSAGSGTGSDYATVKYDAEGNQVWVARYNGPGNRDDTAAALALDDAGNVCVTGEAFEGSGGIYDFNYATIKYDANGNPLWVRHYDGPENHQDSAGSVAADGAGNIYVTGSSRAGFPDYATIKYDADGNRLWVQRYNGPIGNSDYARALALDNAGNVYVAGESVGSRGWNYATIKYSAGGEPLWVARYEGPGSGDFGRALAVDGAGNLYVTGQSSGGSVTGIDYATIKYVPVPSEAPALTDLSPSSATRGSSALPLTVTGTGFVVGSTIQVNGTPCLTTYLSPTQVQMAIPAADFALSGIFPISVVNPGGIVSNALPFTVGTPDLRIAVADRQRVSGGVRLTLRLENRGDANARSVRFPFYNTTLMGVSFATSQIGPPSISNLPVGGSGTVSMEFRGSFPSDTRLELRVQGTYNGGSFAATRFVTLP